MRDDPDLFPAPAEEAVLRALVALGRPATGNELQKAATYRAIYVVLSRLEARRLVASERTLTAPFATAPRRVYLPTPCGRAVLDALDQLRALRASANNDPFAERGSGG